MVVPASFSTPSTPPTVRTDEPDVGSDEASSWHAGYVQGHADASADIYRNASAHVAELQSQLKAQQIEQLEAAVGMMRCKYEERHEHERAAQAEQASTQTERRLLALRQYIEMRRVALGKPATKPWRMTIRRAAFVEDVLHYFGGLTPTKRAKLFAPTWVSFTSHFGDQEDGDDRGGLTAELFSLSSGVRRLTRSRACLMSWERAAALGCYFRP